MYDHKYAGSYLLWHQDNFLEEREKTFCMKWVDDDVSLVWILEFSSTLYSTSIYFHPKKYHDESCIEREISLGHTSYLTKCDEDWVLNWK